MRTRPVFSYFLNCTDLQAAKKLFKKLAIELHPDKHQGSKIYEEKFKNMKVEYDYILDVGVSFPVANATQSNFNQRADSRPNSSGPNRDPFGTGQGFNFDDFEEFMRREGFGSGFNQSARSRNDAQKQREAFNKAREHERKQAKTAQSEYEMWEALKRSDSKYHIIDGILDECIRQTKKNNISAHQFLMEVFKLDELTLKHFKYIAHRCNAGGYMKLGDDWCSTSYRNYVSVGQIKWDI